MALQETRRGAGPGHDTDATAIPSPHVHAGEVTPPGQGETLLADFLGWFSLGLGLTEVVAPRQLARLIGVNHRPFLFRFLGLREIASGIGILTRRRPVG